ncbi:Txe/YoeB family addiction module toxin [Fulvivirgaceae bacterium BMA12]|uniref:Putative mRNA interferase YoeB n=1 Tax=Agaribacillus aureus TaxID=3051825 RepID=A0ABT8L6U4_9BACT|nr:Txe/YoeB family addiction module toxin [Fulvivirgaceae bacterium BMA12]
MNILFTQNAWEEYSYWQKTDKKIVNKINELVKTISRTPFDGIGKPEPLRGNLQGFWSRRISQEHRLVYKIEDDLLSIVQCRFHY